MDGIFVLKEYRQHADDRAAKGIVPKPLNVVQTTSLIELLKHPPYGEEQFLLDLLVYHVPSGVDEAAYVKAKFLSDIAKGESISPLITPKRAIELLGTMQGGYNVQPLIDALDDEKLAPVASKALSYTLLIFNNFYKIKSKAEKGNIFAKQIIQSWAKAEWFTINPPISEKLIVTVFKVTGETNTDDLSPAQDAWSRTDIPLHALSMLKNTRNGIEPDQPGVIGPIKQIENLKKKGFPLVYVGDIVGTGSSRKSAVNSILWFIGRDIPYVPNKRNGGLILGSKIAPIFFNTIEDAGALPIEVDVSNLDMGDVVDIYPFKGEIRNHETNKLLATFILKNKVILDEVRVGGRISMIIGRNLTIKACETLGIKNSDLFFFNRKNTVRNERGYSLAQKIVGRACGMIGVHPGTYCEPKITSIGSQDTTGPMTQNELKDIACLHFSSDLVIQSFCHTAAYPKPIDTAMHRTLSDFMVSRGGVALRPGDGIIHSWLNRMLLPDTVGTGGDSHTRFPIGISFPAGSNLVAFAAATGLMPLDMPESVLINFKGNIQSGIALRDLVHAIPLYAIKKGLLTLDKKNKKNVFSGRIIEITGLQNLKVEQAFELTDSSAERSASGCAIKLNKESIIEYLTSSIVLLKWMISEGYKDYQAIERRIQDMEKWIEKPKLLEADTDAEYAAIIEIDLENIKEPILCVPNDPDNVKLLSEIQEHKVHEVFIGSCMTNISHFHTAGILLNSYKENQLPTQLWIAPPTRMDAEQLIRAGYYNIFNKVGARIEIPGCSLCMGNQARVSDGATVVSTSTRNFPNRLGNNANVYLASAEVASITAMLGRIPKLEEYRTFMKEIYKEKEDLYLRFNQISQYNEKSKRITIKNI